MTTLVLLPGGIALRRPAAVREVMSRLLELDLTSLPRSARAVLLYLASLMDVRAPATPVHPRRATIARETGFSEPTIYRALDALEAKGWISRDVQRHAAHSGHFGESVIALGSAVVALFQAPEDAAAKPTPSAQKTSQLEALPGDAPIAKADIPAELVAPTAELVAPAPTLISQVSLYVDQRSSLTRSNAPEPAAPAGALRKKMVIPDELRFLESVGQLRPDQIVTLMATAKRKSVWLQDLVAAKADVIRKGSVKNLFAYLRSLVDSNTDWTWARRHREDDVAAATRAGEALRAERGRVQAEIAPYAGKVFVNAAGRRFEVDSTGQRVTTWRDGVRRVGSVDRSLIEAIASGVLKPASAE